MVVVTTGSERGWMVQFQLVIEGIALVTAIATLMTEGRKNLETLGSAHFTAPVFDKRKDNLMRIAGQRFPTIGCIIASVVELVGPAQ